MLRQTPALAVIVALLTAGCGRPAVEGLRDSFAQQLATNQFVKDFQRDGDNMTFSAPGAEGGIAMWRVHIDSAVIEPNDDPKTSATQPYKGTVKSSWYSDGQIVQPGGGESNLPFELISNGLSQDCWAFWDEVTERWSWE
jgi:hypothetical protein